MKGPRLLLLAAVVASPVIAYLIYRTAKALGFLDAPADEYEVCFTANTTCAGRSSPLSTRF